MIVAGGLTVADVRELIRAEVRPQFEEMTQKAADIATDRAVAFADHFIDEMVERNPQGLSAAQDPDFQHGLITAQREFARSGDAELRSVKLSGSSAGR